MMARLIRVELLRLWSRRLVKVVLAVLVGGVLVINLGDFLSKDASTGDALARAEQEAEAQYDQCRKFAASFQEEIDAGNVPPEAQPPECRREDFRAEQFLGSRRYVLAASGREDLFGAGFGVTIVAFLVGTSFAGAEWAAGTMAALLFWEPRRVRVLLAKVVALAAGVGLTSLAVSGLQMGLSVVKGSFRGSTADLPDGFWGDRVVDSGRMAAIVVFAALLSFGIAGIARVTAAALGIAFAYFAILENVIRGLRPQWRRYLIGEQFQAWLDGSADLPLRNNFSGAVQSFTLERARAGFTMALYLTIVLGVMIALFARRDVT